MVGVSEVCCPYGSHRAEGRLPQPAPRLDATMEARPCEMLIDVELLNLDSTSMKQIAEAADHDAEKIKQRIFEIVATRGKMHNPVTNSGGVLVGRVASVGSTFPDQTLKKGELVCPIVSLSMLPLQLYEIHSVNVTTTQIAVRGQAILFQTTIFSRIPGDFSLPVALGLIDIAGAPARTLQMVKPGMKVAILGAGKAGLVSAYAARSRLGQSGRLVVMDVNAGICQRMRDLQVADDVITVDLQDPIESHRVASDLTKGELFDIVISVTSAPQTEGAAILATRQAGRALLFSMATSFQAAALSAEGAGKDVELLIGNGYVPNCVEDTLNIVRRHPELRREIDFRFAAAGA
jgi:L-erythro-3,5-diaminohexanoate dehydrogenase